jgi:hypothetical protein
MQRTTKMAFKEETPDAHLQLAREKSALLAADMALARWTSGNSYAQVQLAQALRPSRLSQWHDTVQMNFNAWLAAGGFAASDPASEPGEPPVSLEKKSSPASSRTVYSDCH